MRDTFIDAPSPSGSPYRSPGPAPRDDGKDLIDEAVAEVRRAQREARLRAIEARLFGSPRPFRSPKKTRSEAEEWIIFIFIFLWPFLLAILWFFVFLYFPALSVARVFAERALYGKARRSCLASIVLALTGYFGTIAFFRCGEGRVVLGVLLFLLVVAELIVTLFRGEWHKPNEEADMFR